MGRKEGEQKVKQKVIKNKIKYLATKDLVRMVSVPITRNLRVKFVPFGIVIKVPSSGRYVQPSCCYKKEYQQRYYQKKKIKKQMRKRDRILLTFIPKFRFVKANSIGEEIQ